MPTPPLTLGIDTSEVDDFVVKFPVSGAEIAEKELDIALDDALGFIEGQVVDFMPTNTGIARGSVYSENRGVEVDLLKGIDLEGFVSSSDFEPKINAIEYGRAAGKMPPVEAIALWVKQRGLAGVFSVKTRKRLGSKAKKRKEDLSAAWAIAIHIMRHGTKPQWVFKQAAEASEDYIDKVFNEAVDDIINHWSRIK